MYFGSMKTKVRDSDNHGVDDGSGAHGLYSRLMKPLLGRLPRRLKRVSRDVEVTRRGMMRGSVGAAAGLAGTAAFMGQGQDGGDTSAVLSIADPTDQVCWIGSQNLNAHDAGGTVGDIDISKFDPTNFLETFDYGQASDLSDGRTLREYSVVAIDRDIEIAPGLDL